MRDKMFTISGLIGVVLWFPLVISLKNGADFDSYLLAGACVLCFFIMLSCMISGSIDENTRK